MSGGSLDYLYCKEPEELFNHLSEIEDVEDECRRHNFEDIARDCRRLIEYIKSAYIRIEVLSKQLKDVFHAVEWYQSADYGEDDLIKHLETYRNRDPEKVPQPTAVITSQDLPKWQIEFIKKLIEESRPRAVWIVNATIRGTMVKCSNCQKEYKYSEMIDINKNGVFKICPECGARMTEWNREMYITLSEGKE